ncbi:MAG: FmdE family protein [Thermomonas sp.]
MKLPAFYADAPVVHTHDSLAQLLGAATDGDLDYSYADVVRLAGHSCPTVAGAFLMGRAALQALYPDGPAERGQVEVAMPAPVHHGTTGVVAQVLTLLTGAAADNGFQGLGGRYARNGLLTFASRHESDAITFRRRDNGTAVALQLDTSPVPGDPRQRELLTAIMQDTASDADQQAFATIWQERVRRMLVEFVDDPRVVKLVKLDA